MKAFFVICLFCPTLACAAELRVAVGMPYKTAVINIRRCGGKNDTKLKQGSAPDGTFWWIDRYKIEVVVGRAKGRVSDLSFIRGADLGVSKVHDLESEHEVKSLTFDTN